VLSQPASEIGTYQGLCARVEVVILFQDVKLEIVFQLGDDSAQTGFRADERSSYYIHSREV
jgi:hypothetical protein